MRRHMGHSGQDTVGVVEQHQASPTLDEGLDAGLVVIGGEAGVTRAVVQQADAGDAGHVVEQHAVRRRRRAPAQDHLGAGCSTRVAVTPGMSVNIARKLLWS